MVRKLVGLLSVLLVCTTTAQAAVSFVASASGPGGGGGPHTTGLSITGSNVCVVTGVLTNGAGTPAVTFDGNALTAVGTRQQAAVSGYYVQLFLLAIGTGAGSSKDFVVTAGSGNTDMYPIHAAYAGCSQTGQPDADASGSELASTILATLTSVADQCWLVAFTYNVGGSPETAGTDTYLRQNNSFTGVQLWDSDAARSPGSNSLEFVGLATLGWQVMSIKPVASTTRPPSMTLLGVAE